MTELVFLTDAYQTTRTARVVSSSADGIVLDESLFYATGGGQPGDSGRLTWDGGETMIDTCRKGDCGSELVPAEGADLPDVGAQVTQEINWDTRYGYMKIHTALHLLSVVIPLGVTGGSIGADKGRLDFLMPEPPADKQAIEDQLNALIDADHVVHESSMSREDLAAKPELVKTLSVQPPEGAGPVRLVIVGEGESPIDLQPCGGTHIARTGEIGRVRIGKIENKGKSNRRVNIHLVDA